MPSPPRGRPPEDGRSVRSLVRWLFQRGADGLQVLASVRILAKVGLTKRGPPIRRSSNTVKLFRNVLWRQLRLNPDWRQLLFVFTPSSTCIPVVYSVARTYVQVCTVTVEWTQRVSERRGGPPRTRAIHYRRQRALSKPVAAYYSSFLYGSAARRIVKSNLHLTLQVVRHFPVLLAYPDISPSWRRL